MIYPVIILITTSAITSVIIFFVIPKIMPIFVSLKIALPLSTRILIASISFIRVYFLPLIAGLVVLIVGSLLLSRIPKVKYLYDRIMLNSPLIGTITIYYNTVNLTRTLGVLLKSGIKIINALEITAGIMTNLVYKEALMQSIEQVKKGDTIYKYLSGNEKIFPSTVTRIIEVGEKTGNLETNLTYLSEFYEILEPAMLILMGLIVGFVAISIITPIYQVTQNLQR